MDAAEQAVNICDILLRIYKADVFAKAGLFWSVLDIAPLYLSLAVGVNPSRWTNYVRVTDRILGPGQGRKGSCHEKAAVVQFGFQTPSC